jgi:hypothetical protein
MQCTPHVIVHFASACPYTHRVHVIALVVNVLAWGWMSMVVHAWGDCSACMAVQWGLMQRAS